MTPKTSVSDATLARRVIRVCVRATSLSGNAQISTAEVQRVRDRQPDVLTEADCERLLEDNASGGAFERPSPTAHLDRLRTDAVLVVFDLDWLGRRAGERITLIDELDSDAASVHPGNESGACEDVPAE